MLNPILRIHVFITSRSADERGVTTVEWLGMAAVVVLVVAFLLPQVRNATRGLWESVVGELEGMFS